MSDILAWSLWIPSFFKPCLSTTYWNAAVTAFWVSLRFKYPRTQNASVFGIRSGDTQNAKSELNKRQGQVRLLLIIMREHVDLHVKANNCVRLHSLVRKKRSFTRKSDSITIFAFACLDGKLRQDITHLTCKSLLLYTALCTHLVGSLFYGRTCHFLLSLHFLLIFQNVV